MLGYLSTDIICSEKRTIFQKRSSRKTVSYEVMSKDKYPSGHMTCLDDMTDNVQGQIS